ncbi:MAG: MBOAT family protein [Clostridia bacterium]|nr:MBOAT family protein [Clostridia bacterium]
MLFSSFTFLFFFLPITLLFYFALPILYRLKGHEPHAALPSQNLLLLVTSLLFYAWGEPIYLLLMLLTVLINYPGGRLLARKWHPKAVFFTCIATTLLPLFYFKYSAFFCGIFGLSVTRPHLPLGISFYTFKVISYLADVYRGRAKAAENLITFGVYITFFPQLLAGPIVQYNQMETALSARTHSATAAANGARRFIAGFAKKMLIAGPAGALLQFLLGKVTQSPSAVAAWLLLLSFTVQIYFDFSGYSDMAIGLGQIFGFDTPENFNYPYTATSFTDFWRRWHISLSSFFRDYVYIPLGGSRNGIPRTVLALFVVWSLTGLWHGAAPNFLLWGLYYFLFLLLEKFLLAKKLTRLPIGARRTLTFLGVLFGWLLFLPDGSSAALSLTSLPRLLGGLIGLFGFAEGADLFHLLRHIPFFALAFFGATPLPKRLYQKIREQLPTFATVALPLAVFCLSLCYLASDSFTPFLYFRF